MEGKLLDVYKIYHPVEFPAKKSSNLGMSSNVRKVVILNIAALIQVSHTTQPPLPPVAPVLHLHLFPTTPLATPASWITLCMGAWRVLQANRVPHWPLSQADQCSTKHPPQLPVVLCWSVCPLAWPGQPVLCSLKSCDFPLKEFPGDPCVCALHCILVIWKVEIIQLYSELNRVSAEVWFAVEKFGEAPGKVGPNSR